MKREFAIQIRIGRRTLVWGLAGLIVCGLAYWAISESLTFTTYYPSPFGVYGKLFSTKQTILARDSGNVGIGTSSPDGIAAPLATPNDKFIHLKNTGDGYPYIFMERAGAVSWTNQKWVFGIAADGSFGFFDWTSMAHRLGVNTAGDVRVGNPSPGPAGNLQVWGNVNASGDVCASAKCLNSMPIFGGMYLILQGSATCQTPNPATGGCSCPAGFTATTAGTMATGVGLGDLFYCWKA